MFKILGSGPAKSLAVIREQMREIAAMRRRFGYRRVGVMLERKGHVMNHKNLYRLYRRRVCRAPAPGSEAGPWKPDGDARARPATTE